MEKKLLAVLVLGIGMGCAYAQTNVTIYGQVDTGVIKQTGSDTEMGNNENSLIGFKGSEALSSETQAVFRLEQRFNGSDGTKYSDNNALDKLQGSDGAEWQGAAYVGLANNTLGTVKLGRVDNLAIENYGAVDPFSYFSVGIAGSGVNLLYSEQMPNTLRYDSPEMGGFSVSASYTVGKDTHEKGYYHSYGNDGFSAGVKYTNGGLWLTANYDRLADSDKSWLWNAGLGYTYEGLTLTAGYQGTLVKRAAADALEIDDNAIRQKDWIVGLVYDTGPHTFKFSYNRGDLSSKGDYNGNMNRYALGYVYSLSKRTSLYGIASYTDSENNAVGSVYNTNGALCDSVTGVQFGITHKF